MVIKYIRNPRVKVSEFVSFDENGDELHKVRYLRGTPRGVLIGYVDEVDGLIRVGWSLCNEGDEYDRMVGMEVAVERALSTKKQIMVPQSIAEEFSHFMVRLESKFPETDFAHDYYTIGKVML